MDRETLLRDHREHLLRTAGVRDQIIEKAGLRSIDKVEGLSLLGISAGGILFPYFNLRGEIVGYRLRLDEPKPSEDANKPIRYFQKAGTKLHAYFLPDAVPAILDSTKQLVVTEGEKKALALAEIFDQQ